MGTDLGDLVGKEEISLDYLQGRKVGIDSYNIIYQFLSSIRGQDGTPLMDSHGNVTSHLTGLLYRTVNLLDKGIKPVFVFDGIPPEQKRKTLEQRTKIRTEAIARHEKALKEGNLEEAKKYGSRALKLTDKMVEDAKQLLGLMGLPVVEAPSEGEAQIAQMALRKDLYGCVSQDFDALLFGAPVLLRNIAVTGKRKVPGRDLYIDVFPEKIELEVVLKQLGIDRRKLVWIGILIGTDFNEKFPSVGPKTALKLVKENKKFEKIINATGFEPGFDYREIEKIFLEPKFSENYELEFRVPEKEKIFDFLCGKHDFSEDRVKNALSKLEEKAHEKGQQSRLDKWLR